MSESANGLVEFRLRGTAPRLGGEYSSEVAAIDREGAPCAYTGRGAGRTWVYVPAVGAFSLQEGSHLIVGDAEPGVDLDLVLDGFYGMALPLTLQGSFGYEVLHASAVHVRQRGVIGFSSVSSTGKSTFARALAQRGHELWADDALALKIAGDGITSTALPFRPKLRPEASDFLGKDLKDLQADPVRKPREWSSAPLLTLFVLDPSQRGPAGRAVEIAKLTAPDALSVLLSNGFRFRPLDVARENRLLLSYVDLVAAVPVFRLTYERRFDVLSTVLDEVEAAALA